MGRKRNPVYCIGDAVRVVDKPYVDCPFSWVDAMDDFCGREAKVLDTIWFESHERYGYIIDIDDGEHTWCAKCLDGVHPDIEESDANISILLGGV